MNILLLSDSHGHPDRIREAAERTRPDCILFAGDGLRDLAGAHIAPDVPVYAVRGNCDARWDPLTAQYPEEQILVLDGVRILLTHGHTPSACRRTCWFSGTRMRCLNADSVRMPPRRRCRPPVPCSRAIPAVSEGIRTASER